MNAKLTKTIDELIEREGGSKYTNDPNDSGGPTRWGVTEFVYRANGYFGPVENAPREVAVGIYEKRYWFDLNLHQIDALSPAIAEELLDTGVNMGTSWPGRFLQSALNAFNQGGKLWPDMKVDGRIGPLTLAALRAYLAHRGATVGRTVMLRALNAQQGARYLLITEADQKNEDYTFGWFLNRVT